METVVFSKENGSMMITDNGSIILFDNDKKIVASTCNSGYKLPQSLIRKQPTDEELANSIFDKEDNDIKSSIISVQREAFLIGLKYREHKKYSKEDVISFGKWLQKEDTEENADKYLHFTINDMFDLWFDEVHNKAIYPTSITVQSDENGVL